MRTLHEDNLEEAQEYLRMYKETRGSKLFRGAYLRYFTKEELIKILDIMYVDMFDKKEE